VAALATVVATAPLWSACRGPDALAAQEPPDRVLVRSRDEGPHGRLDVDRGASGVWHRLQKLRTTASVLYTAGHPDDEEAGALTLLSRGMGARTALLTLNRGEGGANALGPELFDALGMIRSEELRLAGRYYGLDDQYYTTAVDYGYSKTLDEAMRSWNREALLGDMVRIIRLNRPTVVISRWHGSARDGHGHHQASGILTPEAVEAAADPARFPEQISQEGLRPWRVRRLYRARLLPEEPHDAELDPSRYDPWIGHSYADFGAYGLSLQRSQTQGRVRSLGALARYERLPAPGDDLGAADDLQRETGHTPLDGLPTRMQDVGALVGESVNEAARRALTGADDAVARAVADFDGRQPVSVAPHLAEALDAIREARAALRRVGTTAPAPEVDFVLAVKERQAADALLAAVGLEARATATPRGAADGTAMGPAVPGQPLDVHVVVDLPHWGEATAPRASLVGVALESRMGGAVSAWEYGPQPLTGATSLTLSAEIPEDAEPTRPWYHRDDIRSNRYQVRDSAELHLGEGLSPMGVRATLLVEGAQVTFTAPVRRIQAAAPFGSVWRPLEVAPAFAVSVSPALVLPRSTDGGWEVTASVTSNAPDPQVGVVRLELPEGWRATPERAEISFAGAGELRTVGFRIKPTDSTSGVPATSTGGATTAHAVVEFGDRSYRDGYTLIEHPDLQSQRLYTEARVLLPAVSARVPDDVRVGYVMGVGDAVPEAIEQLGATVTELDAAILEAGDLAGYDAIVVGTRAYAVRPDLVAANARLLEYARGGGHLVVLYQTPEYDPRTQAPFPATLPGNAEETSEEDAPVALLAPEHPIVTAPYRISAADFEGWVEQRGSKFFATWDPAYTALVETHDTGQAPQEGVWVTAPVGEGRYTYVALALHRQLPYGVPGAYRILANLLVAER
jgi:LmbE family N-acetylglucosaminyl deacetylase